VLLSADRVKALSDAFMRDNPTGDGKLFPV